MQTGDYMVAVTFFVRISMCFTRFGGKQGVESFFVSVIASKFATITANALAIV